MQTNKITVLVDNESWILPYAQRLIKALLDQGYPAQLARRSEDVGVGWVNFMLGCTRIVGERVLIRNRHNLVVHESDLPKGRGFAPMTWQILEGKKLIPICLIEAASEADAGNIWLRDWIELDGTELNDEWRSLQGEKTIELCLGFIREYNNIKPESQMGVPSYYMRRRPEDSRLDPDKTLREQFAILRVVDNDRYPAFFDVDGGRYILKIEKINSRATNK